MQPLSQSKVIRVIEKNGFKRVRSRKHITFKKIEKDNVLTTWVPHHRIVTAFVLNYIIKQTEKSKEEFR